MSLMNITPDNQTYNFLIRAASHEGDIELAEKYLSQARQRITLYIKGFGESKYFYTSLMQVYTDIDADMGYKILQ